MQITSSIEINSQNCEEVLPEFSPDFPYLFSKAYPGRYEVLWHWHHSFELFYIKQGELYYETPSGSYFFAEGSGGLINSGVLHKSRNASRHPETIQFIHLFEPSFLGGHTGSLIEQKYVTPFRTSSIEIVPILPDSDFLNEILADLKMSFSLDESEFGYEIKLREKLSNLWLKLLKISNPQNGIGKQEDNKLKIMLIFIHKHFRDKIYISDVAESAFVSERECYRLFQQFLHTTPSKYIQEYRLQKAGSLLIETNENITNIGLGCGFGGNSTFSEAFKKKYQCTPKEYRRKWQNLKE